MESHLMLLGPPVSRDRVISDFPKVPAAYLPTFLCRSETRISVPLQWYTPEACLQLKDHFHGQVQAACQERRTGTVGLKVSKVVVLGDLYVGKTSLINRFCKDAFDRDYKATIGVDFEIERFQIAGIPYSLQIWDTAGQEKFKCIASAYYRGAQVIITAFDLADIQTLGHTRQWLAEAQRENEPGSSFVFLVGTKKDLLSGPACEQTEMDAVHLANEMQAEYWSVSAKTGENVKAFFTRVAALAFEQSMLQELEKKGSWHAQIGTGASISISCFFRLPRYVWLLMLSPGVVSGPSAPCGAWHAGALCWRPLAKLMWALESWLSCPAPHNPFEPRWTAFSFSEGFAKIKGN
ncbi:ras-related protein Rab-36 isoform X2 [Phascolarctos cinereus]